MTNKHNLIDFLCLDILSYSIPNLVSQNHLNLKQAVQCGTNIMENLIKKELEEYFRID